MTGRVSRASRLISRSSSEEAAAAASASASKWRRWWSEYDLGNLALLISLIAILGGIEQVSPHHRYIIDKSDPNINYPRMKEEVPTWMLVPLVGVIPIGLIVLIYVWQRKSSHALRELYCVLYGWFYAMVLTLIFTSFIKRVSGRPRPNFVQLSGYQEDGSFTASDHDISNAFQSFPSGHTSSAFSGLGYLSLYFFRLFFPSNFKSRSLAQAYHVNQGWKTVICLLPIGLATWIGLTRIVDYWHGYDDVSVGAVLGISVCSLTFQLHVNWLWRSLHGETSHDIPGSSSNGHSKPSSVAPSPIYAALRGPEPALVQLSPPADAALLDEQV